MRNPTYYLTRDFKHRDKVLHVLAGGGIAAFALTSFSWPIAVGASFAAGIAREAYGKIKHDAPFDWLDVAFTVLGGAIGVGGLELLDVLHT